MKFMHHPYWRHYGMPVGFVASVIVREFITLAALLYMLMMVLYHMFPTGWHRLVWWDLLDCRHAYNTTFHRHFVKSQ